MPTPLLENSPAPPWIIGYRRVRLEIRGRGRVQASVSIAAGFASYVRQVARKPTADGDGRSTRTAALLGIAAGATVAICFLTGVISHLHQHPVAWFDMPARPVSAYRVTQGLHVISGIAAVPLVLAKLWVVYPHLFRRPPVRGAVHAAQRLLLVPLVAGTLFQLVTGLVNIVQWYPWRFFFPSAHWATAWIVVGALLVHLAFKAPLVRLRSDREPPEAAAGPAPAEPAGQPAADEPAAASGRRAVLLGAGAAVGVVTLATAGQTIRPLRAISLLAPRDPAVGPQGLPVNRTARSARVEQSATDPAWRLLIDGPRRVELSLAELAALPQHDARLPIACVEGWSASGDWSGVRLRDLLDLAGIADDVRVRVVSLERGLYQSSPVGPRGAQDPLTLLALRLNGDPLALDHGFPARLIGPNRPGVLQTKWVSRIEVS
jgi:DMSO/TMAO reductase YedYZ molybdopterin-dependent catalytic subunit